MAGSRFKMLFRFKLRLEKDRSCRNSSEELAIALGNIARWPTDELVDGLNVNFCGGPLTQGDDFTAWFMLAPGSSMNGAKFCFMFPGI